MVKDFYTNLLTEKLWIGIKQSETLQMLLSTFHLCSAAYKMYEGHLPEGWA